MAKGVVEDSVSGALFLSVFDFILCFFVLWFFGFVIRLLHRFQPKEQENEQQEW